MPLTAYRVAHTRFRLWSGAGAALTGARWNVRGQQAIYAAGSYAGALLEHLVRLRLGRTPAGYGVLVVTVPDDVGVELVEPTRVPGWDALDYGASQAFAADWFAAARTAVLRVPSTIARPFEWNLVVNPTHRDAERIQRSAAMTVAWDERLFGASVAHPAARR